jgi:hypothetical protein
MFVGGYVAFGPIIGRGDTAQTLVVPLVDLAPPYDFVGVRDALHGRGITLIAPTREDVVRAGVSPDAFRAGLPATVSQSYPGQRAQVVSVHLAIADINDPQFGQVVHRLFYIVETTGHATGNCFTLYDASAGQVNTEACFFTERGSPST